MLLLLAAFALVLAADTHPLQNLGVLDCLRGNGPGGGGSSGLGR